MKFDISTITGRARAMRRAPEAATTQGKVRGRYQDDRHIAVFQSIPYAEPPVGELRWAPPVPAKPWKGAKDCTKAGAMAHQRAANMQEFISRIALGLGLSKARQRAAAALLKLPRRTSEDCLTLNVRTPVGATGLAVMVWVHGGDHTDGSSTDVIYNANTLPERGCVLVSINYRLGLFGFFAHPELAAESATSTSGNYGLLDQIAALSWVRDNIANFGGDPNNVTIFGESAGGQAVLNLMTAPAARGLFHRAISQSPSDSGRWLHHDRPMLDFIPAVDAGRRFGDLAVAALAADSDTSSHLAALRAMDAEALNELYQNNPALGRYFYPCVDGTVLPETPMTAFSFGRQAPVPLMIGYNADEGSLFWDVMHPAGGEFELPLIDPESLSAADVRATLVRSYGSNEAVDGLLELYPGLLDGAQTAAEPHSRDHMFGVHVDHASRCHAAAGLPVYRYYFQAVPASPKQTIGAFHAAEITYVFGSNLPGVPAADDAHLLSREMGDRWYAFAATGSPAFPGRAEWPPYDPSHDPTHMVFDRPASGPAPCPAQPGLDLMRARIDYLNGLALTADASTR
jgi:para-nitrobenzyl esterase